MGPGQQSYWNLACDRPSYSVVDFDAHYVKEKRLVYFVEHLFRRDIVGFM